MKQTQTNEAVLLAKAVRMLEFMGLMDMHGHLSYRVPGTERVLINGHGASRAAITAADVVTVDLHGRPTSGGENPPSEVHIHTGVYQRRPDVLCVLHHHPHWQTVLGIADMPLLPVFAVGCTFAQDVPVYEKSTLINTPELGAEVAAALGDSSCLQLRHHGNVVVGPDIPTVFAMAVYLEENARKQYYAALLGRPMRVMEGDNLAQTTAATWSPKIVQKVWRYYEEKAAKAGALTGVAP